MLPASKRYDMPRNGFTLIELLAVMAIIGILAGLMMVGAAKARKKAKITRSQVEARDLTKAWKSYWTIYGKWPSGWEGSEQDMNGSAMAILTGNNGTENPRKYRFMDVNDPKLLTDGMKDPWETVYKVKFSDITSILNREVYESAVFFPNRKRYDY